MAHTAQHALPLRPAALVVITLHAALLLMLLTNLNHAIRPVFKPDLLIVDVPAPVIARSELPPVRPQVAEPVIKDLDPPPVPMDARQDNTPTDVAPRDHAAPVEPVSAEPIAWTRPVVIERSDIPYPTVGATKPEGVVRLRLRIGIDGRPLEVLVGVSSGYPALDRAARTSVIHWRFKPRLQNGAPVDSWAEMPIVFRLED
jgi:protein TonB